MSLIVELPLLLYIPFWIYSNGSFELELTLITCLYIPFWIYSNNEPPSLTAITSAFTFHSGYIPILSVNPVNLQYSLFTFHSGYIPIFLPYRWFDKYNTLHSILDIFQSVSYHTTYLRHLKPYFLSTSIFSAGKVWFSCNSTVYVLL